MIHPHRSPRRERAGVGEAPSLPSDGRTDCPSCGAARYRCRLADGATVLLDPVPRAGGRFLVNPYTCTVVAVQPPSRCRDDGFDEHRTVCASARAAAPTRSA